MKKLIIPIICLIAMSFLVSATPTIVKTTVDVNLNSNSLIVSSEGSILVYENVTIVNGSFYPIVKRVDSIFIRDVGNNSEMASLISQLATYNSICGNKEQLYEECMSDKSNLTNELTVCNQDRGYKGQFDACNTERATLQTKVDSSGSNNILYLAIAFIVGAALCYGYFINQGRIVRRNRDEIEKYPNRERV